MSSNRKHHNDQRGSQQIYNALFCNKTVKLCKLDVS